MATRWPALIRSLPDRVVIVQRGGAIGLADGHIVIRQDWLAETRVQTMQHAVLHLAAHAALGHRPWRWHPADVDARLDAAAQHFMLALGVPSQMAAWHDDHHGTWRDVPIRAPGEHMSTRAAPEPRSIQKNEQQHDTTMAPEEDDTEGRPDFDAEQAARTVATRQSSDGRAPSSFQGGLSAPEMADNRTDWRALLSLWLLTRAHERWQFGRPSRRQVPPFILPRLAGKRLNLVLALDVSGSIDPMWVRQFLTEAALLRDKIPMQLRLITCDNRIHEDRIMTSTLPLPETGGGGTDFRPVFERLNGDWRVDALVYCTDLIGQYPDQPPHFPVFWLVPSVLLHTHNGASAPSQPPPFGRVLSMIHP